MARKKVSSKSPKAATLTILNGLLLSVAPETISASLNAFVTQPLPILAMMDLRMVIQAIFKHVEYLNNLKSELLKKHGAVEEKKDSNLISITSEMPGWQGYLEEYGKLCERDLDLPIKEPIKIAPRVKVQGKEVDIVMDGVAATVLQGVVEVVR